MSDTCRSYSAPITWVVTTHGKAMPLNREPDPDGRIVLDMPSDPREAPTARVLKRDVQAPMPRFTSHFASCKFADLHRRPK